MSAVAPADSTYAYIERKIRRLTSSPTESTLPTAYIQTQVNTFYNSDFPYAIKLDQMRSVYSFYTRPYVDTYPLDVNYNQGVRGPMYVDGIQGAFYKDRQQFFNLFPKWPTQFQQSEGVSGSISNVVVLGTLVTVTTDTSGLISGDIVTFSGIQGITGVNGNTYSVTVVDATTLSFNAVSPGGSYTGGGSWISSSSFNFYVSPTPFLRGEVTIGGTLTSGSAFSIGDIPYIDVVQGCTDTLGKLQLQTPGNIISKPTQTSSVQGMKNLNLAVSAAGPGPGQDAVQNVGTVNYVTGQMVFRIPGGQSLAAGTHMTIWVSQYSNGRPYTMLFWNNQFTVRPVPKLVHKVTVETYLSPVQFMLTTDNPILNQWAQYIAYGVSAEIMRDRNDFEAVAQLMEGMQRQESLVLERQGIEEIGNRNVTIFSGSGTEQGWNQYWGLGGWS